MRKRLSIVVAAVLCGAVLAGCGGMEPAGGGTAPDGPGSDGFVGRAWVSGDAGGAPARIRVFLSDGTLVMDSCVETYRLARWERAGDGRIAWQEDTSRVEAELIEVGADVLRLRLLLMGGETTEETYRPAPVPFVCPDLPRETAALGEGLGDTFASCQ